MTTKDEVRDFFLNQGKSVSEIHQAMANRLAYHTVRKYVYDLVKTLSNEELEAVSERRRARAMERRGRGFRDRKTISPIHVRIGAKIGMHRIRAGQDPDEFAKETGFSNRISLRAMELGLYDFKLSEIINIAGVLGTDVEGLLQPPASRI